MTTQQSRAEKLAAKLEAAKELARQQEQHTAQTTLNPQEIGYTSKLFVQALFPYRKQESKEREIQTAEGTVSVYSPNGLPYGKYPRLIMAYVITRAVEHAAQVRDGKMDIDEARRIPLGKSMNGFLEAIGVTSRGTGGANGNLIKIRDQIIRLAGSTVTAQTDDGVHAAGHNTQIVEDWSLWVNPHKPDQELSIESTITLTPQFFQHIVEAPIPIDLDVLRELNKPRSIDLYVWLTVKNYWLRRSNRDSFLFTWDMIAQSFSTKELKTSNDLAHFRTDFKNALKEVTQAWPGANIDASTEGVTVGQAELPVAPKRL